MEQIACLLASLRLGQSEELYQILDATGVPVRCIKRRGGGWLAGEASKGWCSRISSYMGFHVLMAITPTGFLTGFGFSPASVHDTRLAETFLGLRAHPSARSEARLKTGNLEGKIVASPLVTSLDSSSPVGFLQ